SGNGEFGNPRSAQWHGGAGKDTKHLPFKAWNNGTNRVAEIHKTTSDEIVSEMMIFHQLSGRRVVYDPEALAGVAAGTGFDVIGAVLEAGQAGFDAAKSGLHGRTQRGEAFA